MKKRSLPVIFGLLIASFSIIYAQVPAPENLNAETRGTEKFQAVYLYWDSIVTDNDMTVTYNIYKRAVSESDEFQKIFMCRNAKFVDKNVFYGRTYQYYVTASVGDETSDPSDTVTITVGTLDTAKSAVLTGSITDDESGEPLMACINLVSTTSFFVKNVKTDSSGMFNVRLYPGSYIAYICSQKHYPEFYDNVRNLFEATKITLAEGDSMNISAGLAPITLPQTYTLSGTVTDTSGSALRANIYVAKTTFSYRFPVVRKTHTNAKGEYSVKLTEGDTVIVYANAPKYYGEFYDNKSDIFEADQVGIDSDKPGIDFVLEKKPYFNSTISGSVSDTAGNPVAARVTAIRLESIFKPHLKNRFYTLSDSTGNYEFTDMPSGTYLLKAHSGGAFIPTFFRYDNMITMNWREADQISVDSGATVDNINFIMQPVPDSGFCRIRGMIRNRLNQPVPGAIVYAKDENGMVAGYAIADENGNYNMEGLMAGQYTITGDDVYFDESATTDVTLDYSEASSMTLDFTIEEQQVVSVNSPSGVITNFSLSQNYPNPFNPTTMIKYQLPANSNVSLKIYDILGQEVKTLVNRNQQAGSYEVRFDASNLASGIYLYSLRAGDFTMTKKMLLLK